MWNPRVTCPAAGTSTGTERRHGHGPRGDGRIAPRCGRAARGPHQRPRARATLLEDDSRRHEMTDLIDAPAPSSPSATGSAARASPGSPAARARCSTPRRASRPVRSTSRRWRRSTPRSRPRRRRSRPGARSRSRSRAELFFRIRELLHERREEIAKILTPEHGKVLSDAMGEVTRGLEVIEFCCGIPTS